jgi:hypothetical protein
VVIADDDERSLDRLVLSGLVGDPKNPGRFGDEQRHELIEVGQAERRRVAQREVLELQHVGADVPDGDLLLPGLSRGDFAEVDEERLASGLRPHIDPRVCPGWRRGLSNRPQRFAHRAGHQGSEHEDETKRS